MVLTASLHAAPSLNLGASSRFSLTAISLNDSLFLFVPSTSDFYAVGMTSPPATRPQHTTSFFFVILPSRLSEEGEPMRPCTHRSISQGAPLETILFSIALARQDSFCISVRASGGTHNYQGLHPPTCCSSPRTKSRPPTEYLDEMKHFRA